MDEGKFGVSSRESNTLLLYTLVPMQPAQTKQFEHPALKNYLLDHAYDEMFAGPDELHPHYEPLFERFSSLPADELQRRKHSAELSFLNQGITFTVYGRDDGGKEHSPSALPRSTCSCATSTMRAAS
jgi:hypothetical protein